MAPLLHFLLAHNNIVFMCLFPCVYQDRRDELEGLDLAIERQKRNLKDMKREEKGLKRERTGARGELEILRDKNTKKLLKM